MLSYGDGLIGFTILTTDLDTKYGRIKDESTFISWQVAWQKRAKKRKLAQFQKFKTSKSRPKTKE